MTPAELRDEADRISAQGAGAVVVTLRQAADALEEARAEVERLRVLGPDTEARVTAEARAIAADMLRPTVDAWRADNTALRALLADVGESLSYATKRDGVTDALYDPAVQRLSDSLGGGGYGAIMDAASRLWRMRGNVEGGEFIVGPCRATVDGWLREMGALNIKTKEKR